MPKALKEHRKSESKGGGTAGGSFNTRPIRVFRGLFRFFQLPFPEGPQWNFLPKWVCLEVGSPTMAVFPFVSFAKRAPVKRQLQVSSAQNSLGNFGRWFYCLVFMIATCTTMVGRAKSQRVKPTPAESGSCESRVAPSSGRADPEAEGAAARGRLRALRRLAPAAGGARGSGARLFEGAQGVTYGSLPGRMLLAVRDWEVASWMTPV